MRCTIVVLMAIATWISNASAGDRGDCVGKDLDQRIAGCSRVIESGNENKHTLAVAYNNRGMAYDFKGDYDRAVADFNKAIDLEPRYTLAYFNRGHAYYDKHDADKAIADLDRAIELDPKLAAAYSARGTIYNNKYDYDRALADLNRAIELDPKFALAYFNRGNAEYSKGDVDQAIANYDRAIELDPNYAPARCNRGYLESIKGDYDRAIADLNRAIELNPKYALAYSNRGEAYLGEGQHDLAIADLDRGIKLDSKLANGFRVRARIHSAKGEYDLALTDFNEALQLQLQPNDPAALAERGETYEKIGDIAHARADFNAALVSPPRGPFERQEQNRARQRLASLEKDQHGIAGKESGEQVSTPTGPGRSTDKRVALVIGNSEYSYVVKLDNPVNDARLMADSLKALGFKLIGDGPQLNLDKAGFDNVVQKLGNELLDADVGLFYYAGHGVQVRGTNYLVPVGANPTREADVDFQMVDVNLVLRQMEGSRTKLNVVMLDACRNNPFGGRGLRSSSGGLAQMQAPEGTLISYATQPGNVALDEGSGGDSPYTKALAEAIRKPGLDVVQTFNAVGLAVKRATGGQQQPWLASSPIEGVFYFAGK